MKTALNPRACLSACLHACCLSATCLHACCLPAACMPAACMPATCLLPACTPAVCCLLPCPDSGLAFGLQGKIEIWDVGLHESFLYSPEVRSRGGGQGPQKNSSWKETTTQSVLACPPPILQHTSPEMPPHFHRYPVTYTCPPPPHTHHQLF